MKIGSRKLRTSRSSGDVTPVTAGASHAPWRLAAAMEGLEKRLFFSASKGPLPKQPHRPHDQPTPANTAVTITSVTADNRGEATIALSDALDPATVTKTSVQMYTAGVDRVLGTADDTRVSASVKYSSNRVTVSGNVRANTPYRIKFVASRIHEPDGTALDGDFNGSFPSGNGAPGGNFEFAAQVDRSDTPQVRMSTTEGVISLKLFKKLKPASVANFLAYANRGDYDGIFWTRSITTPKPFLIQAGSLRLEDDDEIDPVPIGRPLANEFTDNAILSNTRGTIAFAKTPGDPDSATNQFFLNLDDNGGTAPYGLDFQNGGFTVFGQVTSDASAAVMDAIAAHDSVALYNDANGDGVIGRAFAASTSLTDTPVVSRDPIQVQLENVNDPEGMPRYTYVATGGFDASRDLLTIRRVAVLAKVAAVK